MKFENHIRLIGKEHTKDMLLLCPHIRISGNKSDNDSPEYYETLDIFCKNCKQWFNLVVDVN